ncbi:hypothetical protein C816_02315 [Oscillibacter sp. 1-3]|nr:hypothetical protein C816_02315 [Oscillibacter sp. 1-3]
MAPRQGNGARQTLSEIPGLPEGFQSPAEALSSAAICSIADSGPFVQLPSWPARLPVISKIEFRYNARKAVSI